MKAPPSLVAAALALTSCRVFGPPVWFGTFGSSGGMLGAWTTTPWSCSSGVHDWGGFMGRITTVSFRRRAEGELTTGHGRYGYTVSVIRNAPFREVELRAERCARFDVRHVLQADGSIGADVEVDCDTGDGGRVVASLHAASCR